MDEKKLLKLINMHLDHEKFLETIIADLIDKYAESLYTIALLKKTIKALNETAESASPDIDKR